jgi:hypothetical protein
MFADFSRWGTRPRTTTWLRRITAVLAAVTGGLLAWAAAVPAASAATILIPDPGGAPGPVPATPPAAPVQVIAAGGMPGWQIILIAVAAALVAATAAILLDRARAARRTASAPTA